ncbi:SusC/RagA family TonB-linked outer membrane protein [Marinigracilibium pacificum]|uniref:SusC/RagA family TonB-linked outer membrane protein n=1 Tax=Marinigracilibium pacificum TaxID=2729599 RepID=A0A848JBH7_9BACT|nr:SusC/RagA family TonB-linked outer membrane protein [Marinigracilibium pacificum]NMM50372.1 SusC/RagA family TonB-linked outer membrane protein [Marinigracilibium pacificum]
MRNKFLLTIILTLTSYMIQAQVKGTIKDESGEAIPGVSVFIKGTTKGAVSNAAGEYSVDATEGEILIFSFIGYQTIELTVSDNNQIDVVMHEAQTELSEFVVTALGVERKKASLSYAVQEVDGGKLTQTGEQNYLGALSGKVAGVQITNPSSASIGGTVNIRIRGANSISGNAQPLFVVDGIPISNDNFSNTYNGRDYGNLAQDINSNDIESISVLKGPAASALYGIRGKNGVILITTKKGTKKKGIGIEYNGQLSIDKVAILPEYQNQYAGGYSQELNQLDGEYILDYHADESWGPEMDGRQVRHWDSWYPGTSEYGKTRALVANPDNVKNFYETGITQTHNIAISGGSENTSYRLSYGYTEIDGAIPFSGGKKNNASLNINSNITDKLRVNASVKYAHNEFEGRPGFGYTGSFDSWSLINVGPNLNMWTQRQLDYNRLKDYRGPNGEIKTWNIISPTNTSPNFWDNIYFMLENAKPFDERDRFIGGTSLTYDISEVFSVTGSAKIDFYDQKINNRIPEEAQAQAFFKQTNRTGKETNYELLLNFDKTINKLSLNGFVGGNILKQKYIGLTGSTSGGLTATNWFNLEASVDRPFVDNWETNKEIKSIYGTASIGYNNFLYLDLTARNDWSSALPANNNSYFYPSAGLSMVFSELISSKILSHGKIRASYAQVGNDIDPYLILNTYPPGGVYNGTPSFGVRDRIVDPNIKASLAEAIEVGAELNFFNNRLGLDVNYYRQINEDDIIEINISGVTGYNRFLTNGGKIISEGLELAFFATPIETKNFSWDLNFNLAKNKSTVEHIYEDITAYPILSRRGVDLVLEEGSEWGVLRGRDFKTIDGQPVVRKSGSWYHANDEDNLEYLTEDNQVIGHVLPDFTGGLVNTLSYKGINLSLNFDFQKGGNFHSVTKMYGFGAGQLAETVGLNDNGQSVRDRIDNGGGFPVEGVYADGSPASGYASGRQHAWNLVGVTGNWIYDASYIKLREVRLGYQLPTKTLENTPFTNISFAVSVRNAWLIHSNVKGIDPSEITPDASGVAFHEGGGMAGFRSYGFNLKLGL